jgi:hypothetical protein
METTFTSLFAKGYAERNRIVRNHMELDSCAYPLTGRAENSESPHWENCLRTILGGEKALVPCGLLSPS